MTWVLQRMRKHTNKAALRSKKRKLIALMSASLPAASTALEVHKQHSSFTPGHWGRSSALAGLALLVITPKVRVGLPHKEEDRKQEDEQAHDGDGTRAVSR